VWQLAFASASVPVEGPLPTVPTSFVRLSEFPNSGVEIGWAAQTEYLSQVPFLWLWRIKVIAFRSVSEICNTGFSRTDLAVRFRDCC